MHFCTKFIVICVLTHIVSCVNIAENFSENIHFQHTFASANNVAHPQVMSTCDNGNTQLRPEWLEDDYCDCEDGSDERTTSACAGRGLHSTEDPESTARASASWAGGFVCRNSGFLPRHIDPVYVDDGICDCCSGEDEPSGYGNCTNTCSSDADSFMKRRHEEVMSMDTAINNRAKVMKRSAGMYHVFKPHARCTTT
jgi:Glucosidase II beta subunit-like